MFIYTGFAESPAAGTAVNLVHGTGVTYVYFAPGSSSAKGLIVAYGDVEAADVKVDSGVAVVTSGLAAATC